MSSFEGLILCCYYCYAFTNVIDKFIPTMVSSGIYVGGRQRVLLSFFYLQSTKAEGSLCD